MYLHIGALDLDGDDLGMARGILGPQQAATEGKGVTGSIARLDSTTNALSCYWGACRHVSRGGHYVALVV